MFLTFIDMSLCIRDEEAMMHIAEKDATRIKLWEREGLPRKETLVKFLVNCAKCCDELHERYGAHI